ncbi:MAG TPA: cell division protein FtsL [Alphaproteobacteria bacterium]|nr:cell division protein FtsL [Alphaproteobacteria bacterium]
MNITGMISPVRRSMAGITPEFYFHKAIDNSRLVKISDPRRTRELRMFSAAVAALFLLTMFYAWQHFSALEYGYQIEAEKAGRERLVDLNRALKLEEAALRDPSRIDSLARKMGLESPQPGQVVRLDAGADGPVIAQVSTVAIIPAQ